MQRSGTPAGYCLLATGYFSAQCPTLSHVDGMLELGGPRGGRDVQRFTHEAMATVFEVHAVHPDARYAAQAAQAAFDLADRLEGELSRFLPNSDIGRVNELAAGGAHRVSPSTMECLVIARHVFDLTGGAFDVSIGTGLPSLELDPDASLVRATRERRAARPRRHRQGLRGRPDGGAARGVGRSSGRSSTAASAPSSPSRRRRDATAGRSR